MPNELIIITSCDPTPNHQECLNDCTSYPSTYNNININDCTPTASSVCDIIRVVSNNNNSKTGNYIPRMESNATTQDNISNDINYIPMIEFVVSTEEGGNNCTFVLTPNTGSSTRAFGTICFGTICTFCWHDGLGHVRLDNVNNCGGFGVYLGYENQPFIGNTSHISTLIKDDLGCAIVKDETLSLVLNRPVGYTITNVIVHASIRTPTLMSSTPVNGQQHDIHLHLRVKYTLAIDNGNAYIVYQLNNNWNTDNIDHPYAYDAGIAVFYNQEHTSLNTGSTYHNAILICMRFITLFANCITIGCNDGIDAALTCTSNFCLSNVVTRTYGRSSSSEIVTGKYNTIKSLQQGYRLEYCYLLGINDC